MSDNIESMQRLINAFTYLPGVGRKTAERYAYSVLNLSEEDVRFFAESLIEVKQKIKFCSIFVNLEKAISYAWLKNQKMFWL